MTSNADFVVMLRSLPVEHSTEWDHYASLSEEDQNAYVMQPVRAVEPDTHQASDDRVFLEAYGTGLVASLDRLDEAQAEVAAGLEKCESVIERRLYAALCGIAYATHCTVSIVRPQVVFGKFRVDFVLKAKRGKEIVIECDGHDFHERTKEQARRDRGRDRFFASKGITVVRFTGSEIWANPVRCAEQAFIVAVN